MLLGGMESRLSPQKQRSHLKQDCLPFCSFQRETEFVSPSELKSAQIRFKNKVKMPRFTKAEAHIPKYLRDSKSQKAKFRRENFWRPLTFDLIVRLIPFWLDRIKKCSERPSLGFGEIGSSEEEVGYHLMLVGPETDFYIRTMQQQGPVLATSKDLCHR